MAKLLQSYLRLVKQLENDYVARKLEMEDWERKKHHRLRLRGGMSRKQDDEVKMIDEVCEVAEEWLVKPDTD